MKSQKETEIVDILDTLVLLSLNQRPDAMFAIVESLTVERSHNLIVLMLGFISRTIELGAALDGVLPQDKWNDTMNQLAARWSL